MDEGQRDDESGDRPEHAHRDGLKEHKREELPLLHPERGEYREFTLPFEDRRELRPGDAQNDDNDHDARDHVHEGLVALEVTSLCREDLLPCHDTVALGQTSADGRRHLVEGARVLERDRDLAGARTAGERRHVLEGDVADRDVDVLHAGFDDADDVEHRVLHLAARADERHEQGVTEIDLEPVGDRASDDRHSGVARLEVASVAEHADESVRRELSLGFDPEHLEPEDTCAEGEKGRRPRVWDGRRHAVHRAGHFEFLFPVDQSEVVVPEQRPVGRGDPHVSVA